MFLKDECSSVYTFIAMGYYLAFVLNREVELRMENDQMMEDKDGYE
jgi:hypothetical protein